MGDCSFRGRFCGILSAVRSRFVADTADAILTNEKIFQFSHSTCRIIGQHVLCGKENLIVSEYNFSKRVLQLSIICDRKELE